MQPDMFHVLWVSTGDIQEDVAYHSRLDKQRQNETRIKTLHQLLGSLVILILSSMCKLVHYKKHFWELQQLEPDHRRCVCVVRFIKNSQKVLPMCGNDLNPFSVRMKKSLILFSFRENSLIRKKSSIWSKNFLCCFVIHFILHIMQPLLSRFILCFMFLVENSIFFELLKSLCLL